MELKKLAYERIGVLVAVISLIVAVIGVTFQIRSQKTRELSCDVIQSSELTSVSEVPGLEAEFKYKDKKVVHLWKTTLSFVNTGSDTLIGEGQHNNLIGDGITLGFPSNTEILNVEVVRSDFPVIISQDRPSDFKLSFSQWRSGERINAAIYVASQSAQKSPLLPTVNTRDIVDGRVVVRNAMIFDDQKRVSSLERLPISIRIAVKAILTIVCLIPVIFGLYVIPDEAWKSFRVALWERRHRANFEAFVSGLAELSDADKTMIKMQPRKLPKEKWQSFKGEELELDTLGRLFTSSGSRGPSGLIMFLTFGIGSILVGIVSLIYIGANCVDVYHAVSAYFVTA